MDVFAPGMSKHVARAQENNEYGSSASPAGWHPVIMIAEKSLWSVFRKQQDPKELVRKWQGSIRTEIRGVERQMLGAALFLARRALPTHP